MPGTHEQGYLILFITFPFAFHSECCILYVTERSLICTNRKREPCYGGVMSGRQDRETNSTLEACATGSGGTYPLVLTTGTDIGA